VLDDEATAAFHNTCAPSTPTITGTLRPLQLLSAFDGETLGGTWVLHIQDEAVGDAGAIQAWSLIAGGGAGDVDCNASVNSIDAALVLQFVAALVNTLPCPGNADVNGSGGINSIDASLILQRAAGLLSSLPV
jgi:hypothetical protein